MWNVSAFVSASILMLLQGSQPQPAQSPPANELPRFTADSLLLRPSGFEAWVMVGSSIGLSYNPAVNAQPGASPGMFHNVYLQPWAYRQFKATGKFPEGSMFVLTFFASVSDAAPARRGFYPADPMPGFEVHVKRAGLHESGWAFFGFDRDSETSGMVPATASCYSCHAKEAWTDHVFTQFYPALRQPATGGR